VSSTPRASQTAPAARPQTDRERPAEQRVVTEPVPVGQPSGQEFGDGLDIPDFLR